MKALEFFESKKTELIQISIENRKNQGLGAIYIDMSNPAKADCSYLPLQIIIEKKKDLADFIIENNKKLDSLIYFFYIEDNILKPFAVDLNTKN